MKPDEKLEGALAILASHLAPGLGKQKWTKESKAARNRVIYTLLVRGYSTMKICYFLIDNLGITKQTALAWLKESKQDAIPEEEDYRRQALQIQLERLQDIVENGSEKGRILALDQINKLLGLYKEKVEVETTKPIEFTFG